MNAQFLKSMRAALIVLLSAHQIYAAPTCNQLVCADVVKAQKVATNKLCVSGDANFGGDVTIDGDLVVSGSIVNTISPIEGWWLNTIKGNFTNTSVLWHIYHNGQELRAHLYAGYQGRYREWTPEDFLSNISGGETSSSFVNVDYIPGNDFVLQPRESGSWIMNPLAPDSPEYFSPVQNELFLNVSQSDPNVIYTNFEILRLVRLAQAPEIETFDNPAYIDNTNPIKIFENVFKTILLSGNPQFSKDVQASDYPGFAAFTEHKNILLTTGVSYESEVKDVWRTRTDFPVGYPFPLSTTFITVQPPNPRLGARVVVSGFNAPYDVLNNDYPGNPDSWEASHADNENGRNGSQVYGPEYYMGDLEKFMLTIIDPDPALDRANTSSITESYNPEIHGIGKITLIVDPVTASTEYRALAAAIHDLESFADRSTHTFVRVFLNTDTLRIFPTFAELQAGLDSQVAAPFAMRSRGYNGTRSGGLYVDIDLQNVATFPAIPTNDPTGISLYDGDSPTAFYSIDLFNYLDPERTYNMYWALTGPSISGSPITTEKLVDFTQDFYGPGEPYYKTPGSEFIFQADNYYNNYAFNNTPPDPATWSIFNAGNYHDYNNLVFGILDPAKTCGQTIAYISLLDELGLDPAYNASLFPEFTSNRGTGPLGALSDCFAAMLETLNAHNPTSYIINFRGNAGGLDIYWITLSAFFGDNRPGYQETISFADNGNRPGLSLQEIETNGQLGLQSSIDAIKVIDTDLFALNYPNAMVRTPGTKIIFMTDTNSGSSGDAIPHFFRNNDAAAFGDLGSDVTCELLGDIDGRLFGEFSRIMFLFNNASNNITEDSVPTSALYNVVECAANTQRLGENNYVFSNQHPVVAPDLLFNMDIENTFWLDVGSKGTYPLNPIDGGTDPLVLPLSAGVTQPVYGTDAAAQETWRDRVLEAAIMMIVPEGCFEESVRDAKVDAKVKAQKAKLVEHLAKRRMQKRDPKRERLSIR